MLRPFLCKRCWVGFNVFNYNLNSAIIPILNCLQRALGVWGVIKINFFIKMERVPGNKVQMLHQSRWSGCVLLDSLKGQEKNIPAFLYASPSLVPLPCCSSVRRVIRTEEWVSDGFRAGVSTTLYQCLTLRELVSWQTGCTLGEGSPQG